jgi:hypothetical protein
MQAIITPISPLAPISLPAPYISPINHLIHTLRNTVKLESKYETLLQNDTFREFVQEHDATGSHAPTACQLSTRPLLAKEHIIYLFEELHAGNGMAALVEALNKDGYVVIMDEWRNLIVYINSDEDVLLN